MAIPLTLTYLIVSPPAGDLAAATYRSALFGRAGFTSLGHRLVCGARPLATGLFAALARAGMAARRARAAGALGDRRVRAVRADRAAGVFEETAARIAAVTFAVGFCVELLSGRVPYDLGFAIGLGAVLALMRGATPLALVLAVATSVASPVAGAFLAMAGVAGALAGALEERAARPRAHGAWPDERTTTHLALDRLARHCLALTAASLTPIVVLSIAFPEGGYEPFAPSLFWMSLGGVLLIALLLPQGPLSARGRRVVRVGAALYALALIGSFAIASPLGGNVARLGPPLAAPLMAGVLWEHRRAALLWLAPLLVYWQLVTPINDVAASVGNPSASATYYTPLLAELERLRHGAPTIVEVPLLESHWEAAYLPGHDGISLARGWDRQLDTLYGAIFYRKTLSPAAYRAWLSENKVYYVALADAPLDSAGRLEGKLVAHGLPYLRELWHSAHWRLYRVMG